MTGVTVSAPGAPAWVSLIRAPNPGPMTLEGTNTWIIASHGDDGVLVVDPGPLIETHLAAVAAVGPVRGVLLTHHHPDHAEGLERFTALTGADVVNPEIDATVKHGDYRIRTIATPGHTADSVSFVAEGPESAVFTGDTVLGRGSTAVLWPDGNLGDYLDSLQTLSAIGAFPVLPGHGPVRPDCSAAAEEYLAHRRQRLDQVREALKAGADSARAVVEIVYADVDRSLWPAAEATVAAQLEYLRSRDGEHIRPPDGW